MSKFPALPLWTDAWEADTHHLTNAECGAYLRLLTLMWRTPACRVPNDDAWLGRKLRLTSEEVAFELRPIIAEFCQNDGNWISQKRLTKEYNFVIESHERKSVAAKYRWQKNKDAYRAYAPTPTPIKKERGWPTKRWEPSGYPNGRSLGNGKAGSITETNLLKREGGGQ